jgi:hypothetical protein
MGNDCCSECGGESKCNIYYDDFLEKKARYYTVTGTKKKFEKVFRQTYQSEVEFEEELCSSCSLPTGSHPRRPVLSGVAPEGLAVR